MVTLFVTYVLAWTDKVGFSAIDGVHFCVDHTWRVPISTVHCMVGARQHLLEFTRGFRSEASGDSWITYCSIAQCLHLADTS